MNRSIEIFITFLAVVILLPVFLVISLIILFDSPGGVIYRQTRVGKDNRDFTLYKFRTMVRGADRSGLLSTGRNDKRVTRAGAFLRNHKLDELPQFFNVLKGDMSLVGPRPEVRKYVNMYNPGQMKVLSVRPGLTDYASLEYIREGELLAASDNPERLYVQEIMPAKLALNLKYIEKKSPGTDFRIIFKTIGQIF